MGRALVLVVFVALFALILWSLGVVSASPGNYECSEIGRAVIAGKPSISVAQALDATQISTQTGTTNVLSEVPAFSWSYGCAPTAAAMLFGYYDRTGYDNMYVGPTNDGLCPLDNRIWGAGTGGSIGECPLSATRMGLDGRTTRGHVDNYWVSYGSQTEDPYITYQWTEHDHADCTGDFMGSNQYAFGNIDGATYFYYYLNGNPLYDYIPPDDDERDGCHGLRLFAESRGYEVLDNFTQLIKGKGSVPSNGFTFEDFQNEIECGRPVLVHLENHTVLGHGYDSGSNTLYIHDTWDHELHTMTWGGTYAGAEHWGVTVIRLSSVVTKEASDLSAYSATFNGLLVDLGEAPSVEVSFEYGATSGKYTHTTPPQVLSSAGEFSYEVSGLSGVTTYYFRARAFNGSYTYGVERSLTTEALPPEVATDNATMICTDSARLNGVLNSLGTATEVEVYFEWGVDQGAYTGNTTAVTMTGSGAFGYNLTGLTPGISYYFRSVAHGHEITRGDQLTFTTLTHPPVVSTLEASGVTIDSGTLNGDLISLGTASSVEVWFEWGLSPGNYIEATTAEVAGTARPFSTSVSGLPPGTTCYFRIVAVGHSTSYGIERSFTTGTIPPQVSTVGASEIGTHSAKLEGSLLSLGTATELTVSFQYGPVPGTYWFETPSQIMTNLGEWGVLLEWLNPGTTYYFKAKAVGHGTVVGSEMTFTTLVSPSTLSSSEVTDIGAHSVVLCAGLSDLGTAEVVEVSFEYGIDSDSLIAETPPQVRNSAGEVSYELAGLYPATTYYFRAKVIGHGTIYGAGGTFTTLTVPPKVATVDPLSVSAYSVELKGEVISLGSAACVEVFFEWGTASGGPYRNETYVSTSTQPGEVIARLIDLTPGTAYYFRTKAVGHGVSYGDEKSFTSATLPPLLGTAETCRLTAESAVLTGELISLGTASSVEVSLEWAHAPEGPYFDSAGTLKMNAPGPFVFELKDLEPEKTYYLRVKADGHSHGLVYADGAVLLATDSPFNWLLFGSVMASSVLILFSAIVITRAVSARSRLQW